MSANVAIYDKVVDRAAMLRYHENSMSVDMNKVIDMHEVAMYDIITSNKPKLTDKYRKLLQKEIKATTDKLFRMSSQSLLGVARDQINYTFKSLDDAIGKIWHTAKPNRRVAESLVLERAIYNDVTLEAGWSHIGTAERKRIEQIIRAGIAKGHDEVTIAKAINNSAFKLTRQQSIGLARTAMTSVYSQADHEVYAANEKALLGYQYVAVLDSRTTPLCASRDGKIYPIGDRAHLPPAHWFCRSTTTPVVKRYEDFVKMENVAQVRRRNLSGLSTAQIEYYDGQLPFEESYGAWLKRQPVDVQLRHLGDYKTLSMYRAGNLQVDKFVSGGRSLSIKELRSLTDSGYEVPGDTLKFAAAKEKLDAMQLGITSPDDLLSDTRLQLTLRDYYLLQAGELEGTLSLTNYRGVNIGAKKGTKTRVLTKPPTEENMRYNPLTGRYDDARKYTPNPFVLENSLKLADNTPELLEADKKFIRDFVNKMHEDMSMNERAVVAENLRIIFTRYRKNGQSWNNFKAVVQGQIKYDIMNVSDMLETHARKDTNLLRKLSEDQFLDPVLGPVQLQELHDNLIGNIKYINHWDDNEAYKLSKRLRRLMDIGLPVKLRMRLSEGQLEAFYLKMAKRLAACDSPDRDQLAVTLGRDLYNAANYRGTKKEWYELGVRLLDHAAEKKIYTLESFGVQKRRMKSMMGSHYFGPYYDTKMTYLRIIDPKILEYSRKNRAVEIGLRVGSVDGDRNRFVIRKGYKTYFIDEGILGYYDTRIPITSTSSFSDFPEALIDEDMQNALNWAGKSEYRIDSDFHRFMSRLLNFQDDRGKSAYYNKLNTYREYITERGDAYERFKMMSWLAEKDRKFSNSAFLDHRGRIYERGFIGPQSGESFRPYLSTVTIRNFSENDYYNLKDQIGAFLGGASDKLEGNYNALTVLGRQQISNAHHKELVRIGKHMLSAKPDDVRKVLESNLFQAVDGEEQAKLLRFAIELAKIDDYLEGDFSKANLVKLMNYKTTLALEQDASSSGAQIIAITTRNKQLAELSNVVPTNQKRRLYDEIAHDTFNDPRFKELNEKLGLSEKDLRKAAKAQNMVTFYGAGERTGVMNVENKLAKALEKDGETLVIKAADRDKVMEEISARAARVERYDPERAAELIRLRNSVKESFNKGRVIEDEMLEELYFLDPKTRELVEKLSGGYARTVTPDDFKAIANIMSEYLATRVPILKDFTKYFGRLAETFLTKAKPSASSISYTDVVKQAFFGPQSTKKPPKRLVRIMGIRNQTYREALLRRFAIWDKDSLFDNWFFGAATPLDRRTGFTVGKKSIFSETLVKGVDVMYPNKLDKSWTRLPWVNFDGKTVEQHFTQSFEEKLLYKDADGNWQTNIIQVQQKTDPSWWEEVRNKDGKINEIADAQKARTAFAVNGNHSNDATLVKRFHLWGRETDVQTSTIHDAFFTNAADMLKARAALRKIYADALDANSIEKTLLEMRARGLPQEDYEAFREEAIRIGLIPVVGVSRVGGRLITEADILKRDEILMSVDESFSSNRYWYGVG